MATRKQVEKLTNTTFTTVDPTSAQTGSAAALTSIKAQQDALAQQAKDIRAAQKQLAAQTKAQSVKTLDEVIAAEPTDPKAWSNKRIVRTGAARVARRVRAGQDCEEAINAAVANFRHMIVTAYDARTLTGAVTDDDEDDEDNN